MKPHKNLPSTHNSPLRRANNNGEKPVNQTLHNNLYMQRTKLIG